MEKDLVFTILALLTVILCFLYLYDKVKTVFRNNKSVFYVFLWFVPVGVLTNIDEKDKKRLSRKAKILILSIIILVLWFYYNG